ncbi:putative nucleotide-binding alpha-beta plait domain superfamily, RNA-binding domain superfamily [Helianthus annuus]|uniref:Nucleotide-binding alpha-beta plait domain superfamily, RNA-binding domain superfamily n=1 Tax=Helianthus annuus TaxID=4232 RepID=A0A251VPC3_HELAN|nr:30S ribosomal protein 2, chloroplastic isoform X2 [Helianthus annuus]KAF5822554.1 putative nucleotide-binding alpha-beta plait domain superfamily, RNA-binding domain superfamily [Helianthus annuus]
MATISTSIASSFKPISTKSNPNLPQTCFRFHLSTTRQPTRLLCVAEETSATIDPTSEAAKRLYVGNIPRTTTIDELQKVFEEHGAMEKAEFFLV